MHRTLTLLTLAPRGPPSRGTGPSLTPQIYSFDFPGFKRHKRRRLGPTRRCPAHEPYLWQHPKAGPGGGGGGGLGASLTSSPNGEHMAGPRRGEGGVSLSQLRIEGGSTPRGRGRGVRVAGSPRGWWCKETTQCPPPREQGLGPLLAPLRSASLFILLIKPGPGENVHGPGWRGCQVPPLPPSPPGARPAPRPRVRHQ